MQSLPVTFQQIQAETTRDPVLRKISTYVANGWPTEVSDDLKPYKARQNKIGMEDKCLMWGVRVIIPQSLQPKLLETLHDNHPGITRMKAVARSYFWWSGIDKAIKNLAKSCVSCLEQKVKSSSSTTSSMDMADYSVEEDTHRLCRTLPKQDVPNSGRRTLQVA